MKKKRFPRKTPGPLPASYDLPSLDGNLGTTFEVGRFNEINIESPTSLGSLLIATLIRIPMMLLNGWESLLKLIMCYHIFPGLAFKVQLFSGLKKWQVKTKTSKTVCEWLEKLTHQTKIWVGWYLRSDEIERSWLRQPFALCFSSLKSPQKKTPALMKCFRACNKRP